jgi:hypothetical protein
MYFTLFLFAADQERLLARERNRLEGRHRAPRRFPAVCLKRPMADAIDLSLFRDDDED